MNFTDAVTVAGTRRTADGYLIAEAKAVRTGIQLYLGDEVGKPDLRTVRVYRPAEEVFSDKSLQSFTHAPVTVNHPDEAVNAGNWKDLAVGEVSTAAKKDGDWVWLPLILKDKDAIASVESGKRELSAGYECQLVWGDGVTPEGEAYDAKQTNIKINHLAIVDRARAGSQARIGDGAGNWGVSPVTSDQKPKEKIMTLKTVTVDGIPVEVTDQGAIVITTLQTRLADAVAKITATETAHQTVIAAKDADLAKKDAEIDALKGKVLSDADLDKKVQARADLIAVAKTIAKDVKTEGLTDAGIRKAVVVAKIGDAAVAGKADAYIDARFDILVDEAAKGAADPFAAIVKEGIKPTNDASTSDAAHKAMTDHMTSAWQTKGVA
ncbi:DUF2213 domain-containing protein [Pararhizobium sp. DWP1-1-3]|uniref:DUF2213 domain-containing protein n=1 Tax=Pararhizobium sp. DWP1-1-3 TaxID=2804652 RepID=UPI003CEDC287